MRNLIYPSNLLYCERKESKTTYFITRHHHIKYCGKLSERFVVKIEETKKKPPYKLDVLYLSHVIMEHNINARTSLISKQKLRDELDRWYKVEGSKYIFCQKKKESRCILINYQCSKNQPRSLHQRSAHEPTRNANDLDQQPAYIGESFWISHVHPNHDAMLLYARLGV